MPRPRRRLLIALGFVALLLVAGAVWMLWPGSSSRITRQNGAMLQQGMTLAEAEAILGGPARDVSTGLLDPDLKMAPGDPQREWRSDEVIIHVTIDRDGRVSAITVMPVRRFLVQEPMLTRLRRMIGL
jgi:hypothetical protein